MEKIKAYTDLEQSKKLAEILPIESADMYYSRDEATYAKTLTKYDITHANVLYGSCDIQYFNICEWTPCWSLSALLSVIRKTIGYTIYGVNNVYISCELGDKPWQVETEVYDNEVDACVEMILTLHELNLL